VATYRDLEVWKQSMTLVEQCYRVSAGFPAVELYGLTRQLRRAAMSIPLNIAEGHCRRTTRAYLNHVGIALGSHAEVEACLELGSRLGFLSSTERKRLNELNDAVGRMLSGLYTSLERRIRAAAPRLP
jgi:four helix bundle protein